MFSCSIVYLYGNSNLLFDFCTLQYVLKSGVVGLIFEDSLAPSGTGLSGFPSSSGEGIFSI